MRFLTRATKTSFLQHQGFEIAIIYKPVKNIHLRILPPNGDIQISCPPRTPESRLRHFIEVKSSWIQVKQRQMQSRFNCCPQDFSEGSMHLFAGTFYPLSFHTKDRVPAHIYTQNEQLIIQNAAPLQADKVAILLNRWYRTQLQQQLQVMIAQWQPVIGEELAGWRIQQMKSRWGSCNTNTRRLCFNLHLIKTPLICVEGVVVHELVHLLEASHNARFKQLMTYFLPDWREREDQLKEFLIQ